MPAGAAAERNTKNVMRPLTRSFSASGIRASTCCPRSLYKSPEDIEGIKRSAAINIGALDYVGEHIHAGVTTEEIDQWIYEYTTQHGGIPADLNYEGYPKSVCTSINDVVAWHPLQRGRTTRGRHRERGLLHDSRRLLFRLESHVLHWRGKRGAQEAQVEVTRESVQRGLAAVKPWGILSTWQPPCRSA